MSPKRKRMGKRMVRRQRMRFNEDSNREEEISCEEEEEFEEEDSEEADIGEGGMQDEADLPPALLKNRQLLKVKEEEEGEESEEGDSDDSSSSSSSASSLDEEGVKKIKKQRLPISELGRLYFEGKVLRHSGSRHQKKGLIVVDCAKGCAQMYDRSGKQFGNRPDPGYPIKNDIASLKMLEEIRLGAGKAVRLGPAISETEYLFGSFFLRKNQRRKEIEKQRKKAEAKEARKIELASMNHLSHTGDATLFGRTMLSRGASILSSFRPRKFLRYKSRPDYSIKQQVAAQGYVMPEYPTDGEKSVVLFRAEYKYDSARRRLHNVVVDPLIGDKLRPHQIIGIKFLWDCVTGVRVPGYHGCILADEMGLGKSIQAIALLWTALHQSKYGEPLAKKAIVVAPSSLVDNWCNEFTKWLGEDSVNPCAIAQSSTKSDRVLNAFEQRPESRVLVISYDQLRKYETRIRELTSVGLVICDEGHRLKNAEIKTTKAVDMIPTTRRVILSGTPLQNDLGEFHAMVNFCNPGVVGNLQTFNTVFKIPIMAGREPTCPEQERTVGENRAHYIATLTNAFILQRKATVNEKYLPSKIEQTIFVRPSALQKKLYGAITANRDDLMDIDEEQENKRGCSPALVTITTLKKLCNHPDMIMEIIEEKGGMKKILSQFPKGYKTHQAKQGVCGKMDFVYGLLTQLKAMPARTRDKVVIVSNYTQALHVIASLCKLLDVAYYQLDGATPIKKRQQLVDQFNVQGTAEIVFLLSSKAGGVGLNLIGANRLILYDPDWNPANDAQAMGRVWRDGQKKKVFIYRLLTTGTIEEKIYQRQVSKQGLSANIMDATDQSKQHFTNNDLKSLFLLKEDTQCETHDLLGCKCQMTEAQKQAEKSKPGYRPFKTHQHTGPRMDELKGWDHLVSVQKGKDEVLKKFGDSCVSFLFANERVSQREDFVKTTTALGGDVKGIVCADDNNSEEDGIELDEESEEENSDSEEEDSDEDSEESSEE